MDLFKQLYFVKSFWRFDAGLIELPDMMEPWLN